MKCNILQGFRTSTPFNEKSFDQYKDLLRLKLVTNVDVNPTSSPGTVMNLTFNTLFATPPRNEVRLTSNFVMNFGL